MLLDDLNNMLKGLKLKLYNKSYKKQTKWDENFLKFVQMTLVNLIKKFLFHILF